MERYLQQSYQQQVPRTKKAFHSNQELRKAVHTYCRRNESQSLENVVSTYGYPIDKWDVSQVTNFSRVFAMQMNFNGYIGSWNVSNATNMSRMFEYARGFNQPLDTWDTSNVKWMSRMFCKAHSFNQSLNKWDTSSLVDISGMFIDAFSFNKPLSNWDTSNIESMRGTFWEARAFNQSLVTWSTSKVTDMGYMFHDAVSFNQCLDNWDTSNVENMYSMFFNARSFNQSLDTWDFARVTNPPDSNVTEIPAAQTAYLRKMKGGNISCMLHGTKIPRENVPAGLSPRVVFDKHSDQGIYTRIVAGGAGQGWIGHRSFINEKEGSSTH